MKRLRLLRLEVQPVFVFDDGHDLIEQRGEPFVLLPSEIPRFPEKFEADFEALRAQVEGSVPTGDED